MDYKNSYYFLSSVGRKAQTIAGGLLEPTVSVRARWLPAAGCGWRRRRHGDRPLHGPHVEGAGIHHNPTPGPADQTFVYGHVWVTLSWIVRHPWWGTIGLPLLAKLYVRAKDVWLLSALYGWKFQTKLELAAELVEWADFDPLRLAGKRVDLDRHRRHGRYVGNDSIPAPARWQPVRSWWDDCEKTRQQQWSIPKSATQKDRGRPRKYGPDRISLAKRAGARRGWQTEPFDLYHKQTMKTYKTFLATYPPVGGLVRVVLVREEHGWFAWFCSDPNASVREILEMVADRGAASNRTITI